MDQADAKPNKREERSRKSREAIFTATMCCLVKHGYAETTTSRVCDEAGVSRGALTHHFASKTKLMVETTDWLMHGSIRWLASREGQPDRTAEDDLHRMWTRVIDTPQMRALLEILVAIRTDKELETLIRDPLRDWNASINESALSSMGSQPREKARFVRLWTIARIFFRGLLTHDAFVSTREELDEIVAEFIRLLAPELMRLSGPSDSGPSDSGPSDSGPSDSGQS